MAVKILDKLIGKKDSLQIVREQIILILLAEIQNQKNLAADPENYDLRVFQERANPLDVWVNVGKSPKNTKPIVNVRFDTETFPMSKGDRIHRQRANGIFNLDVYTYGEAKKTDTGHIPGDEESSVKNQHFVMLVRNILMTHFNEFLQDPNRPKSETGKTPLIYGRWINSITAFDPNLTNPSVPNIQAARIALLVEYDETALQLDYENTEFIANTIRNESGEILLKVNYDYT